MGPCSVADIRLCVEKPRKTNILAFKILSIDNVFQPCLDVKIVNEFESTFLKKNKRDFQQQNCVRKVKL